MKLKAAIPVIIGVNVVLFVGWTLTPPRFGNELFETLALFFIENDKFKPWQFVTNMFMHGGFAHILFNMYALWAFGAPLEYLWGKKKFLLFYFVCGIGAAVIFTVVNYIQFHSIVNDMLASGATAEQIQAILRTADIGVELNSIYHRPAVGASGAIYGVLVAFGILFPNAKLMLIFFPFPIAAKYFIPILIGIDLFSGLTGFSLFGGGIAHFAHVGGAAIGFLMMWYWRQKGFRQPRPFDHHTGIE